MRRQLNFVVLLMFVVGLNEAVPQTLTASNYDELVPRGKEVDAIYGDYALTNDAARAVIALPSPIRHANMTVRSIGGGLIDFAATEFESDQLSCFYPGRRKFPFSSMEATPDSVTVTSDGLDSRPECKVTYRYVNGQPVLEVTSVWTNTTGKDWPLELEDDIRADGGNEDMMKTPDGTHDVFYIDDVHWQQSYAIAAAGFRIRVNGNTRDSVLAYEPIDGTPIVLKPGGTYTFKRLIVVGKELPNVLARAEDNASPGVEKYPCEFTVMDGNGHPAQGAQVVLRRETELRGTIRSDQNGAAACRLPVGVYTVNASIGGVPIFPKDAMTIEVQPVQNIFEFQSAMYRPGTVQAKITDGDGRAIPAKVQFSGNGKTPTPNWGPESAEHFVRNLAYTENGEFEVRLQEGEYDVIVSHGPEYDAVFTKLNVESGTTAVLSASLKHSVQTPGWVSSDFHSHSSPSGDNTGSQRGRVLNLAAENIEFAPCTEHNRVSTYDEHINELGLNGFLATVSGMELTGQPLPLNHQNVFPMKYSPRTQDGGGPVTDISPESQIERIALWDDRSEKLIQQNHPDLGWLFYDKDGDGKPDEGFSRSFPLMDVMEVHPIDRVLDLQQYDIRNGKPVGHNRLLNWLQLLNQGHRIYGVVNTDAHYNYHGSGWLRNWIQSGADDPAKIDHMEMVHASEQGRLIMSNGPYLSADFKAVTRGEIVVCGRDLSASDGKVAVKIRVQCPNWIDVDTVFVLINGKVVDEFRFTRADNSDMFTDEVVKFERTVNITLKEDSHLIVVTGHQTEMLGDVMGPTWGQQHPAALTNPVFVDVDGNGFTPNKDTLGFPLPVKYGTEK